jgi:hypothetical protein
LSFAVYWTNVGTMDGLPSVPGMKMLQNRPPTPFPSPDGPQTSGIPVFEKTPFVGTIGYWSSYRRPAVNVTVGFHRQLSCM